MGYYVEVTDVPLDFIEFMGYRVEGQDDEFVLLNRKGEIHIIAKNGRRFLYVEDLNDAKIFEGRQILRAPDPE